MMSHLRWLSLLAGTVLVTEAAAQTMSLSSYAVAFAGTVGGPNPAAQTIAVTSTGPGAVSWRIAGAAPTWLAISPPRGGAPANLSFAVNLAGLSPGNYQATVGIQSNDPTSPSDSVGVFLRVRGAAVPPAAEYEVELLFTGYTGQVDGYPNCAVNTNGTDRLTGRLAGYETSTPDRDVEYEGTLTRVTTLDICETKGRNRPDDIDDEQVWCAATLTGSANMRLNLTVYGELDRGAWLKAKPDTGRMTSSVTGSCAGPTMAEYRKAYPGGSGGGGGSPDGQPIEDAFSATKFFINGVGRLRVGDYPPDPQQGGWSLRVIRKIR